VLAAAGTGLDTAAEERMAGIILTGGLRPGPSVLKVIEKMPLPVLLAQADSYKVASKVHNLTVKTRPNDLGKISLIRDMIARHVNVKKIIQSL
jgi:BioD-like phosphotransacetylase family protein